MNADFTASLLHQLPFGVIVGRGTRIAFISDFFMHEFGVTLDKVSGFCERYAELPRQMSALAHGRSAALELDGRHYCLKAISLQGDLRGFLLLPQVFAAGLELAAEGGQDPAELNGLDSLQTHDLPAVAEAPAGVGLNHRGRVARFEEDLVAAAFRQFGSTRAAARHLGISQSSVVRKLKANGSC